MQGVCKPQKINLSLKILLEDSYLSAVGELGRLFLLEIIALLILFVFFCSVVHDFDGYNQVHFKSTCLDFNNSCHSGITR